MANAVRFCSYCGQHVIPGGQFCKTCGASLVAQETAASHRQSLPVPIELTDKKWKRLMSQGQAIIAIGIVIWICSIGMFVDGLGKKNTAESDFSFYVWYLSIAVTVIGMAIKGYADHQAWWNHG